MSDFKEQPPIAPPSPYPSVLGAETAPKEAYDATMSPRLVHWYTICASSLIVFASVLNTTIPPSPMLTYTITAGSLSFGIALLAILFHIVPVCKFWAIGTERAPVKEFVALTFLTVWWIVAIALITQSGGIATNSLNLYYSSWLAGIITVIALNNWFITHGSLSARDFVNTSPTLVAWYFMLLASAVVMGSAANLYSTTQPQGGDKSDFIYAISIGTIGCFLSLLVILANFQVNAIANFLIPGGFIELFLSFSLLGLYIAGVIILTRANGIASSAGNLYYSSWVCFFNTFWIIAKWRRKAETTPQSVTDNHNLEGDNLEDL
ncbi:hypothetical protein TrST_g6699 [Triparma strigata]|uniref:Uncharacterized protein n=1 Tax=Triparma strigata TaxID=1606541 RepID=A0A9W6ZZQ0_9STRA|nr:hypothetical protein TrST_g6699 [Triparma strigata]